MCPAVVPRWTSDRTAAEASQSSKRTSSVTYVPATWHAGLLRHGVVKPGISKRVSVLSVFRESTPATAVRDR